MLVVALVALSGPATASLTSARPAHHSPATGIDWTAALHHVSVGHRARPLSAPGSISCYAYDVPDPIGDPGAGLDGVDYRLSYDCVHHTWTATGITAQSFADSQLGGFEVLFDVDQNLGNNCGGMDFGVVVAWAPEVNRLVAVAVKFRNNCAIVQSDPIAFSRSSAREISLSWSSWIGLSKTPTAFRSLAALTGSQNPTNGDFDEMPNRGLLLSQLTTMPTFHDASSPPSAGGKYTQIVSGDFNGDHRPDMLFYGAGGHPDYVWFGNAGGGTFTSKSIAIWGTYTLIPGDFNGDGVTDLLLYAPGSAPDAIWFGSPSGAFTSTPITINGSYTIVSADFNGDHRADLLFYAAGAATDYIWYGQSDGSFQSTLAPALNNPYRLAAGDFNGDGYGDVLLVGPDNAPDHVMQGGPSGHFTFTTLETTLDYSMLRVGDFNGDGLDDVLLFNPGVGADALYYGTTSSPDLVQGPDTVIDEDWQQAVVGDFNHDGNADIFFHGPGTFPDELWDGLRTPTALPATTYGAIAVDPTSGNVFVTSGKRGTTMSVLDAHGRLLRTISGLNGPTGVAFGPSTMYVAMTNGQTIGEFDRTTLAPTGSIDTGASHPNPVSLAYQHGKLWFTYDDGLGVWDPGTNIVSTEPSDASPFPRLASGTAGTDTLVEYSPYATEIARYDISSGSAVLGAHMIGDEFSPCYGCIDMALLPDGGHLVFAADEAANGVGVVDTATLTHWSGGYGSLPQADSVVTTSARGGWVVVGTGDASSNDVFLHRVGSPSVARSFALHDTLTVSALAISPDGRFVYSVSHDPNINGPMTVNVMLVP